MIKNKPINKLIPSVLIANRGEISCRIIKTLKRLEIRSVVIYETIERLAKHVALADVAIELKSSYTDIDEIIKIALEKNCSAIHPGYGFLSENHEFAQRVQENNIVFIGPDVDAIFKMGDKLEARKLAKENDLNLIPGFEVEDAEKDVQKFKTLAQEIGYPILIKAAAGGGGKAMHKVDKAENFEEYLAKVLSEAKRLYNNTKIVIEKFIERGRHVEVQLIGDSQGKCFSLLDRDCSMQRNNQKIIEEAPAPNLPNEIRKQMHASSIQLGNAVKYKSVGTVEFLYDTRENKIYFLEMNTRLQVEHVVTEEVTGLDLVEEQLKIAAKLSVDYENVSASGCAIEMRICAEMPDESFMPTTGKVYHYSEPEGERVRVDSSLQVSSVISHQYDNMIAKLICSAESREKAIENCIKSLSQFVIVGLQTNIPLLQQVISSIEFKNVEHYTQLLHDIDYKKNMTEENAAMIAASLIFQIEKEKTSKSFLALSDFANVKIGKDLANET